MADTGDGFDIYFRRENFLLALNRSDGGKSGVLALPHLGLRLEVKARLDEREEGRYSVNMTVKIRNQTVNIQLRSRHLTSFSLQLSSDTLLPSFRASLEYPSQGHVVLGLGKIEDNITVNQLTLDLRKQSDVGRLTIHYSEDGGGEAKELVNWELQKVQETKLESKLKFPSLSEDVGTGSLDFGGGEYSVRVPRGWLGPTNDPDCIVTLTTNSTGDSFELQLENVLIEGYPDIYVTGAYENSEETRGPQEVRTEMYSLDTNFHDIELQFVIQEEEHQVSHRTMTRTITFIVTRTEVTELEFDFSQSRQFLMTFPGPVIGKEISFSHSSSLRFPRGNHYKPFEKESMIRSLLCYGLHFCVRELRESFIVISDCEDCYYGNSTILKDDDKLVEMNLDFKPHLELYKLEVVATPPRSSARHWSVSHQPVVINASLLPQNNGTGEVSLQAGTFRHGLEFQYRRGRYHSVQYGDLLVEWSSHWEKGGYPLHFSYLQDQNTNQSLRVKYVLPHHWAEDGKMKDLENHHRYFFDLKLDGPKNSTLENLKYRLEASYIQFVSNNLRLEGRTGRWQLVRTTWQSKLVLNSSSPANPLRSRGEYAIIWKPTLFGVDLPNPNTIELLNLETCCKGRG